MFGTPSYISPEQAQCAADVDTRADIYSLGVVFFEMLTGKCPYAGSNPAQAISKVLSDDQIPDVRDVTPGVAPGLAVLVRRMTIKDRERRIPTFGAVLEELARLGYGDAGRRAPAPEYAERPVPGMKTLLQGIGTGTEATADPLAEPDDELKRFLEKKAVARKRQMLMRGLIAAAVVGLVVLAIVLLVL